MSVAQSGSNYFSGIPEALYQAFFDLSPTDSQTSSVATASFQNIANDWQKWEHAVKTLNIKLDPLPLRARVGEKAPAEKLHFYRNAIESYYQGINDSFFHELNKASDIIQSVDGYDKEDHDKIMRTLPKLQDQGSLSQAKYHETLRQFIHTNQHAEAFELILSVAQNNYTLLKMLLEEGIQPNCKDMAVETECDKESLAWTICITLIPDFSLKLDDCKLILKHASIDSQGLTFLLWTACHQFYADEDSKKQQLDVIKLLRSKGAQWNGELISDYPLMPDVEWPLNFGEFHKSAESKEDS